MGSRRVRRVGGQEWAGIMGGDAVKKEKRKAL